MICAQNDSNDESDDDNDDMDTEYYGKFIYISINTTCVQFLAHQSWSSSELFWSSIVYLSVRQSVNFSYFRLLLKNHRANFNQTWQKASLGKGDSNFSNEEPCPFPRGDNFKWQKYIDEIPKSSSPEPLCQFQPNLAKSIFSWWGFLRMKGHALFPRGDNKEIAKIH